MDDHLSAYQAFNCGTIEVWKLLSPISCSAGLYAFSSRRESRCMGGKNCMNGLTELAIFRQFCHKSRI